MITTDGLIRDFSEQNFAEWCRGKFADFVPKAESLPAGDFSRARQIGFVRTLADGEMNRPLLVVAVQVDGELSELSSRKRQFEFARKALQRAAASPPGTVKGVISQGLFVFCGKNGDFRMSLVAGRIEGGQPVYNSFKRQTFFVRHNEVNRTFLTQVEKGLGDYKALCEAFSIEALTKQFYNELFAWYEWALSDEMDVRYPNDIHTDKDNREMIPEHMIRLITRLMFVWFIKQKHLVPEEIFKVEELRKLLKDFDPDSETEGNYYNAILQNLFFATLNNKIEDRDFATNGTTRAENENHYGVKTLFRNPKGDTWFKVPDDKILKLFEKVPFLNGGLFECLDRPEDEKTKRILYYDGFSREEKVKGKLTRAHVPNCLFFDRDAGLISLFQRYNFTVEENSPNDAEVALDPELLGKVFENLLGAFNPETQETARKQSGSFYTPREIVSYMVDESLKQYLKTKVQMDDAVLTPLFEEDAKVDLPPAKRKELAAAIRSVKILDPACGSGAFPMGALHRLVDLLAKLEGQAENLYDLKLHLIENCIYGVDIQTIAVQISKLRFFISLVCEQEPNNRKADNYGVLPLPNLETKFVAANTLIGLEKDLAGDLNLEDEEIAKLRKELWDIRHRHFLSKSSQEKHTCRRQDKTVREKMQKRIVAIASTPDKAKIAHLEESICKLEGEKAKYRGEKWETVLVPKQGDLFGGDSGNAAEKKRVDTNKAKREEIEGRIERCERDIAAEKGKKVSRELVEAAENLAAWDPYDQNECSPFFDSEWMFGVKAGFDLVVGNPPYIDSENMTKSNPEMRQEIQASYLLTRGNWDVYIAFYEKAFDLLGCDGVLSFITPDKWISKPFGDELRIRKAENIYSIFKAGRDVFQSVNVDAIVSVFTNRATSSLNIYDFINKTIGLKRIVQKSMLNPPYAYDWLFSDFIDLLIKIDANKNDLSNYGICENACATSDAYKLKDLVEEQPKQRSRDSYFRIINTGTIGKYVSKWGQREMVYLGSKYLRPVVNRKRFESVFPNSYGKKAEKPKLIIKGLNLLDACMDADGEVIPGKTTLMIPCDDLETLKFMLAILNSSMAFFYLKEKYPASSYNQGTTFTKEMINSLPIPSISPQKRMRLISIVDDILAAKQSSPPRNTDQMERQLDKYVYELYGLTKEEIALVENVSVVPTCTIGIESISRSVKAKSKSILVDDEGLD